MRLDPEREKALRRWPNALTAPISNKDLDSLLGEIDYLRGQVQAETHHASELKRQLAGQTRQMREGVSTPVTGAGAVSFAPGEVATADKFAADWTGGSGA